MFRLGSRRLARSIHRRVAEDDMVEVTEVDGVRALHLGNSTVQSAMRIKAPNDLELTYTRGMMSFLLFRPEARTLLLVGLGGGSIPKFVHHYMTHMTITAVEINPRVIEIARSHFWLPEDDDRLVVVEADGAAIVRETVGVADVLMLDAYAPHGIAPDLCSQDFYDTCAEALSSDGVLVVNLWGSDKNFDVYLQRLEQSFGHRVLVMPTGRPGNIVVFAFNKLPPDLRWASLRERAKKLEVQYRIEFLEFVERLRDANPHTSNRLMM